MSSFETNGACFVINGSLFPALSEKEAGKVHKLYKKGFLDEIKTQFGNFEIIVNIFELTKNNINCDTSRNKLIIRIIDERIYSYRKDIKRMEEEIKIARKDRIKFASVIKWYVLEHTAWRYEIQDFVRETLNLCHALHEKEIKPITFTIEIE